MADGCVEKMDKEFILWILKNGRSQEKKEGYKQVSEHYPDKFIQVRNRRQLRAAVIRLLQLQNEKGNWSCDFQRFTKSKKLSKFQVRTTTLFIMNKSLSTSLFNLQGTICCFQRVFTTFRRSQPLINSLFIISKPEAFVKNFFDLFFNQSSFIDSILF